MPDGDDLGTDVGSKMDWSTYIRNDNELVGPTLAPLWKDCIYSMFFFLTKTKKNILRKKCCAQPFIRKPEKLDLHESLKKEEGKTNYI